MKKIMFLCIMAAAGAALTACGGDDAPTSTPATYCFECKSTIIEENALTAKVLYESTTTTNPCGLTTEQMEELEDSNSSRTTSGDKITTRSMRCSRK